MNSHLKSRKESDVYMKQMHTFVVLAYKESKYLEECIKSVINQKYASKVVIATSTPNEFINKIAKQYKLDIIINKDHRNIGGDFDFAVSCANTDLVTVSHQDDVYDYDYSFEMVEAYKLNKDAIILFPNYYELKNNIKEVENTNLKIKRVLFKPLRNIEKSYKLSKKRSVLKFGCSIGCPSVTFNTKKIEYPVFDCDEFKCDVDWLAWERLSKLQGKFVYINEFLMGHRIHADSTTTEIIHDNIRTKEDLVMLEKFWPNWFAKLINHIYKNSEKNNELKKKIKFDNNFDFIKLIAALLVIVSHAYPISQGKGHYDFANTFTGGQFDLGNFSVCVFFIIGGFFITKSLLSSKNLIEYIKKRIRRIFPPLILIMFITTFIIAPFFYNGSFLSYFTESDAYYYFVKNSFMITTHKIPGLFVNNIYNESINGSLWTLPVEFLSYFALIVVYKMKLLDEKKLGFSIAIIFVFTFLQNKIFNFLPIMKTILPLALLFFESSLLYVNRNKINFNIKYAIIMMLFLVISLKLNIYIYAKIIFLPYIIISLGLSKFKKNIIPKIFTKVSYEIYLYAFFIQQCVCHLFG